VSIAIEEALRSLGGVAWLSEIVAAVESRHPGRWRCVATAIADLTYPGNTSSLYPLDARILERVAQGRYRLRRR
jgi:hypothetical protein